jgi:hypothetical protein
MWRGCLLATALLFYQAGGVNMPQEIYRQSFARPWWQPGGSRPNNQPFYYGGDTNPLMIGAPSAPARGGIEPIWQWSGEEQQTYELVGTTVSPPDLPSFDVTFRQRVGSLPRHYLTTGCVNNFYVLRGKCKTLADFNLGWEGYIDVLSNARVTDISSANDLTAFESDDPTEDQYSFIAEAIYRAGQIGFTDRNTTSVTLEIKDVCYANRTVCGECGPSNDGTNWIYAVEKGGAAADMIVHYSLDGGSTWASSSITPGANAEDPAAIRVMGSYLVVLSPTANTSTNGGYYYTPINTLTGAPASSWTKVTAGFTNNFEPRDMVVFGPREAYVCCDGGEILKITDVVSGATSLGVVTSSDLARIHGDPASGTLFAVGSSATVVVSINRGKSFVTTTTLPGAAALTAVHVFDQNRAWVGNSSGVAYYTLDRGETWTTKTFADSVTPTAIQDIRFATSEAGYVLFTASSLGRMSVTLDGGYSWVRSNTINPRVLGVNSGTSQRFNRIAVPAVSSKDINANYAVIGGLGASTDGALQVGAANVF